MNQTTTYPFQSEVTELLQLMIHSLYSHKEIFVRELIANASDAANKLRFLALQDPSLYEQEEKIKLQISADTKRTTITFADNGIGMTREEMIEHLGTIARSGTKAFLAAMKKEQDATNETGQKALIGQFGVGFYSAFMVAERIEVHSRKAGTPQESGTFWSSDGTGSYTVTSLPKETKGTTITIYVKETEQEFAAIWKLRSLAQRFSEHLDLPVEVLMPNPASPEPSSQDSAAKEAEDEGASTKSHWEQINQAKALWLKPKKTIQEEEYQSFYQTLTHDTKPPLLWMHNRVEGTHEYISLLYIPSQAPWDLWNRDHKRGLKLYVKRMFIMEDAEQFLPAYLRFVRGILDSDDLPLNVSRELLQNNKLTKVLKQACTKRVLDRLLQFSKESPVAYEKDFWNLFGLVLKEGAGDPEADKAILCQLLRSHSTYTLSAGEGLTSVEAYIERMPSTQKEIYYLTADHLTAAQHSPHLEYFRKQGIEVLLLTDRIDEWMMTHLSSFQDHNFVSVTQSQLSLPKGSEDTDAAEKDVKETTSPPIQRLIERLQAAFAEELESAKVSHRLIETAAMLTTPEHGISTQMAKLLQLTGQPVPKQKYILEINPQHPLIQHIASMASEEQQTAWMKLLFQQALLVEKGSVEDPSLFVKEMNQLLGFELVPSAT